LSVATAGVAVLVAAGTLLAAAAPRPKMPQLGVYAGPGATGVANAASFATLVGVPVTHILDFASSKSWTAITGPAWLLGPHSGQAARLEYSLPMMPIGSQHSLTACAAGQYDRQWRLLGSRLVAAGLSRTIVRPGWEFNADWYQWSAVGQVAAYVGCFRKIVSAMRQVAGQDFAFDWNPALGQQAMDAELAYPGDAYVDYVGVDAYDTSPSFAVAGDGAAARATAWHHDLDGEHGLEFWRTFAKAHGKPMAIPEWGVVHGADGTGGGDDPAFVEHMFDFMTNRKNDVAYEQYFDYGSGFADHRFGPGTRFPRSQAAFRALIHSLT
jgi:Glycosyl hydrolase family 26